MHERTEIRNAAKRQLESYPTIAQLNLSNGVEKSRHRKYDKGELPAICLTVAGEETDPESYNTAPRRIRRKMTLQVQVTAEECEAEIEDLIDELCFHVEDAFAADETIGFTAEDCQYSKTDFEFNEDGESVIGTAVMSFAVQYTTSRPDVSEGMDDFDAADIKFNLGNAQHEGVRAHDIVSGLSDPLPEEIP